ncbi:MAG: hypothetical protein LBU27_04125 [Candidatus Peribacteria bacterium]|jgi:hypothetical protein|nr:hypothetical protein [Candidatus Peribacteria bacterium]
MKKFSTFLATFVLLVQAVLPNFLYAQATEPSSGDLNAQLVAAQAEQKAAQDALDKAKTAFDEANTALLEKQGELAIAQGGAALTEEITKVENQLDACTANKEAYKQESERIAQALATAQTNAEGKDCWNATKVIEEVIKGLLPEYGTTVNGICIPGADMGTSCEVSPATAAQSFSAENMCDEISYPFPLKI